jgi:hypothetical protein
MSAATFVIGGRGSLSRGDDVERDVLAFIVIDPFRARKQRLP